MVFTPELVRGKRGGRAVGVMAPAEALRQILAGSGLVATQVGERTFSVSQTAAGAADAATLDEVIVTAQKRAQRIQDVPLAVTVIRATTPRVAASTVSPDWWTRFRAFRSTTPSAAPTTA